MDKVFGKKILDLKFFCYDYFNYNGEKFLVSKSGYSKQGGYEIHIENLESGLISASAGLDDIDELVESIEDQQDNITAELEEVPPVIVSPGTKVPLTSDTIARPCAAVAEVNAVTFTGVVPSAANNSKVVAAGFLTV